MEEFFYKMANNNHELTCDACGETEGEGRKRIVYETKCNHKKCISVEDTCTLCIGIIICNSC